MTSSNQTKKGVKKKPLLGSIKPRVHTPLLKGASKIQEVSDLADKIQLPLLDWQRFVLEDMLRVDAQGNFKRRTCGLLVARQPRTGKLTLLV